MELTKNADVSLHIFSSARKTMDSARRFSPQFCKKATELILETDYRMKTSFDEQERLLEMLLLQLAGEN